MANDPQVPWTDEQWARVNQAVQEEARRARVAATFLPLYGPLDPDADFIRKQEILYSVPQDALDAALAEREAAKHLFEEAARVLRGGGAVHDLEAAFAAQERIAKAQAILTRRRLGIDDRDTIRLATLQVIVPVRNAQMADPELTSVLALFRRAANVVARLEDAVVFRGLARDPRNPGGYAPPSQATRGLADIWQITGAIAARGIWTPFPPPGPATSIPDLPAPGTGQWLVSAISDSIGRLEESGQFGPFAVVLGQQLFLLAQTPDRGSLVLPQDRIIPFLGGGPLLRSSTFEDFDGVVVALGGAPLELVVASDMSVQFLQISSEPSFMFRVSEKIALRIREPEAIVRLSMEHDHPRTENGGGDNPGPRGDQAPPSARRAARASSSRKRRQA